jgi:signal peptidase II
MMEMFASGGALLLLDQWSKRKARAHVTDRCISCGPLLRFRYVTHRKGVYKRASGRALLGLVWLTALACAVILHRSGAWFQGRYAVLGLGLAFGGAAGNLLDILRLRSIVDFIDLRWWPVFNLADVAIVAGLAAAFWPPT